MIAADRTRPAPAAGEAARGRVRAGKLTHAPRVAFVEFLRPGDLVIANDAATLPASLRGEHVPSGGPVEVRLAGRRSLAPDDVRRFSAVVFGAGDYRTRTEDRPPPPTPGAGRPTRARAARRRRSSACSATRVSCRCASTARRTRSGPAWRATDGRSSTPTSPRRWPCGTCGRRSPARRSRSSRPRPASRWTGGPSPALRTAVSRSPPSRTRPASRPPATPSWTAGCRSTNRTAFRRLPPLRSAGCGRAGDVSSRSARPSCAPSNMRRAATVRVRAGEGLATQRIGAATHLRVVDAILSGTHEPGTSHYELLRAFTDDATLGRVNDELAARGYRTHEFGDSVLIERNAGVIDERS